jgi:hypothetical protein
MIMSVSILMIGNGAATPVNVVNLSMANPFRHGAFIERARVSMNQPAKEVKRP